MRPADSKLPRSRNKRSLVVFEDTAVHETCCVVGACPGAHGVGYLADLFTQSFKAYIAKRSSYLLVS
jgi:hypothetical protein